MVLKIHNTLTGTKEMLIMEEAAEEAVADTAVNTLSQGVYNPYWLFFLIFVCIIIVTIVYLDYRRSKKWKNYSQYYY